MDTKAKTIPKNREGKRKFRFKLDLRFTPKNALLFILIFLFAITYINIDSLSKIILFALYTMVNTVAIMLIREVQ